MDPTLLTLPPPLLASLTRITLQALLILSIIAFLYCTIAGIVLFVKFTRQVIILRHTTQNQPTNEPTHHEPQEKN